MAVKRKIQKGLATKILCVLKYVGRADERYLAKRFGYSPAAIDRTMGSLERQGIVRMSTVMSAGTYGLTDRGHRAVSRGGGTKRVCGEIMAEGAARDAAYERFTRG
jgi:hypothetical protein